MITCQCSQKIYKITQLYDVRAVGFALFGKCPRCDRKMPVSELFRITERGRKIADRTYVPNIRSATKNGGFEASKI